MNLITVITPTYNRASKLSNLFNSLQNQKEKNFIWLIVDDGSIDNTKEYVENFKNTSLFDIQYVCKTNGGKHTALTEGIKHIKTPLTFIVDSDDVVLPNGTKMIEEYYNKYKDNVEIGVFSFLKCFENNKPIVKMPNNEFIGSYVEERIKKNITGDMAEVFLTKVLREFTFPEFKEEKFLSEDVVWIQIGLRYKYVFINELIYQCEYLNDCLTSNDKAMKFTSPLGSMMRGKMLMNKKCGLRARIKGAIIYNCYLKEINDINNIDNRLYINGASNKILVLLTKQLGVYFNRRWKRK